MKNVDHKVTFIFYFNQHFSSKEILNINIKQLITTNQRSASDVHS